MSIPFTTKKDQLQFINCVINVHDLKCECSNPLFHSTKILLKQLAPEIKHQERKQLQLCLGGEDTTKDDDDIGISTGDLEQLFAEDDDAATTADTR